MRIALIVEGDTEKVFIPFLRTFLEERLRGNMPRLHANKYDGRIPTGEKLERRVVNLLADNYDHVIALTDVYTGTIPPEFADADEAKRKMREWVGSEPRFHPHAAQYDFEAWLLPYWPEIQRLAGHNRKSPPGNPETVNHNNPPAHRISEIFRIGKNGRAYVKPRDAACILRTQDLALAVNACAELKSLVNCILQLCDAEPIV